MPSVHGAPDGPGRAPVAEVLAVLALVAACGGADPVVPGPPGPSAPDTVRVGSADFPENRLLAEIYATGLSTRGVTVERRLGIGPRETYFPDLRDGTVDLVPDYTGNLLRYLDPAATATAPPDVVAAIGRRLPPRSRSWRPARPRTRTPSSSPGPSPGHRGPLDRRPRPALPDDDLRRAPGVRDPPLRRPRPRRDLRVHVREFRALDSGGPLTVAALRAGSVQAADLFTTDPSIPGNDYVVLEDPRSNFPAQQVVPLINSTKLANPAVADVLNRIAEARHLDADRPQPPPRCARQTRSRPGRPRLAQLGRDRVTLLAVVAREERREPVGRACVLGVGVDERPEPVGEPGQGDLLLAATVLELLDAAVGEVHLTVSPGPAPLSACSFDCCVSLQLHGLRDQRLLLHLVHLRDAGRGRGHAAPGDAAQPAHRRDLVGQERPRNGHAPWFAGSSWTQAMSVIPL